MIKTVVLDNFFIGKDMKTGEFQELINETHRKMYADGYKYLDMHVSESVTGNRRRTVYITYTKEN